MSAHRAEKLGVDLYKLSQKSFKWWFAVGLLIAVGFLVASTTVIVLGVMFS